MLNKSIFLTIPVLTGPLSEIYAKHLRFGYGNGDGDGVAERFENTAEHWDGDRLVSLCPQLPGIELDCVHSLYGSAMEQQSFAYNLIGTRGIYCLAAYLAQNPCADLAEFTGIVYAFGGSKISEKIGMNCERGSPWTGHDLQVPVLFLENGRPRSIYTMWHADTPEADALVAYCADKISLLVEHMASVPIAA